MEKDVNAIISTFQMAAESILNLTDDDIIPLKDQKSPATNNKSPYDNILKDALKNIQNHLEKIKIATNNFSNIINRTNDRSLIVDASNALTETDYAIDQIKQNLNNKNLLSYKINFQKSSSQLRLLLLQIIQIIQLNETQENAKQLLENTLKIEEAAKQAAGNVADYELSKHFDDTKKRFQWNYYFWLFCIMCTIWILVTGILDFDKGFVKVHEPIKEFLSGEIIIYSYIVGRIGFMILSLIVLFFTFKHLNIASHNRMEYEYKAVVMKTLPAVFNQYPEAKKEIFIEKLADFLFKHHDTSMNKNTDPGMPYEKVIDLLSKAIGKNKDG